MADLETAVGQLPYITRTHESEIVAHVLQQQSHRRRGGVAIGEVLPAVLARLEINTTKENEHWDRSWTRVRIHTAFRFLGIPALSVHGALADHHRLMKAVWGRPSYVLPAWRNVVINRIERILTGSVK